MAQPSLIKFKLTNGQQETIQLAYEPTKTIYEYLDDLSNLYDQPPENFKLVFKGKVLTGKVKAEEAKINGGTVMVVLNTVKKQQKKVIPSKDQVVKGAGMSTGLGASSPFGVGGYEVVNHPQYMSAISQAVDQDKMEEMLNDPQYQGMLEEMLSDPDTLRHLMENDPMMQSMMKNNPAMKMMLQNETLLKMVLNKDTIKKTTEMMKNGGMKDPQAMAGNLFNNSGSGEQNAILNNPQQAFNPFGNFMNPFAMNNPAGFPPSAPNANLPQNPLLGQPGLSPPAAGSQFQSAFFQSLYSRQLKELQEYGFKDRAKNLQALRQVNGSVDEAMQKLCSQ